MGSMTTEKFFSDQQKKTNDKSKIKSSKPSTSSSSFNMFAEQARLEKDKTNVKNKVADLSKLMGGSIQDGNGSEVYKSLFSTHKTALNQPKGNWVTFDPRHN